jgi:hypothetical protein
MRLVVFAIVTAAVLEAQGYMGDDASTYTDAWSDSSYVFGYGSIAGQVPIHSYSADVSVTSPLGRTANQYGSWPSGFVSTTAWLDWSRDDYGEYFISTCLEGWCSMSLIYFWLGADGAVETPAPAPCRDARAQPVTNLIERCLSAAEMGLNGRDQLIVALHSI